MEGYEASTYGERVAEVYDEHFPHGPGVDLIVDVLASIAGDRRVLELAVGTGRIAAPLVQRGLDVTGIDISDAMAEELRKKPGGQAVHFELGDFADVGVEGTFGLIFVVLNTFFALLTQDDQVRCFRNVAARLEPGGEFVLELFVPDLRRYDNGQRVTAADLGVNRIRLDVAHVDAATQRIDSVLAELSETGTAFYPVALRYAWPSELDLMARLAGLELVHRWADWRKQPFGASSPSHISVYRKLASTEPATL